MPSNYTYHFTRTNGARYYNPRISQFYGVDPLAAKYPSMSPYIYTEDNPVRLVDPTGMGSEESEDWIKNLETGEYIWDEKVTGQENTPEGYRYIGQNDNDIINDMFGKTYFSTSTFNLASVGLEDFDNPYSATGYAVTGFSSITTMRIMLRPDVNYSFDDGHTSKTFNGINIEVSITGNLAIPPTYSEPQPLSKTRFLLTNFTINNGSYYPNFVNNTPDNFYNPDDYLGGYFSSFVPKNDLINRCGYFNIKARGYYTVDGNPVGLYSFLRVTGITQYTNLEKEIHFNN